MFTLTDTHLISCHGTSFRNFEEAVNYATKLRELGLCRSYSIGQYINGRHKCIYVSSNDLPTTLNDICSKNETNNNFK
jgi:hypothetical protein